MNEPKTISYFASVFFFLLTHGAIADSQKWQISKSEWMGKVDKEAHLDISDGPESPFDEINFSCIQGHIAYDFLYRGSWRNAHDVQITNNGRTLIALQKRDLDLVHGWTDDQADKITAFFESGLKAGNDTFQVEALNKTKNDDQYMAFSEFHISNLEEAKNEVMQSCSAPDENKATPVNTSILVGKWQLGGIGPASTFVFSPDGGFIFSYVQTFSGQRVTSSGTWQDNDDVLRLVEKNQRQTVCRHVGDNQTQYIANCSLTGVLTRVY